MKIVTVREDGSAQVDMDGTLSIVDLSLIEDAAPGDHVIVHAGFAIEKLDATEADERIKLFEDLASVWAQEETA